MENGPRASLHSVGTARVKSKPILRRKVDGHLMKYGSIRDFPAVSPNGLFLPT